MRPMNAPADRVRWIARLSLIAAFVCFAANCVSNRLLWQATRPPAPDAPAVAPAERETAVARATLMSQIVSATTSLIVLAGVVLGALGVVLGLRRRQPETALLGLVGLLLNLGIIGLAVWMLVALRSAPAV